MQFRSAIVVLAAPLPDTIIGCSVRSLDVVNQILHERYFIHGVGNLQSWRGELHQRYQVHCHHVQLTTQQSLYKGLQAVFGQYNVNIAMIIII